MTQKTITIFSHTYHGEAICDIDRDVSEAIDDYQEGGSIKVTIEWTKPDYDGDWVCQDCWQDQKDEFGAMNHNCEQE